MEPILRKVFKIASRWRVLLLLDEADVFLSQRSDNPQINALVSVFLRELEQYDGILFLTINRLQVFDEAVFSRVHLALNYEVLEGGPIPLSPTSFRSGVDKKPCLRRLVRRRTRGNGGQREPPEDVYCWEEGISKPIF